MMPSDASKRLRNNSEATLGWMVLTSEGKKRNSVYDHPHLTENASIQACHRRSVHIKNSQLVMQNNVSTCPSQFSHHVPRKLVYLMELPPLVVV
ncbi:hypothetical protein TNIN_484801 [Trichonephila inaurata madagascariensis]|uniref:Uncharacterized protein n=1 Tax=Trichonephila inaurata madagascariensis TaxID=2747483 RepID=A0A8X6Y8Y1_9ARAC|nr:hypothetical protein TNIN_484801 [Trichonephila inaurata madagascariensis]